MRSKLLVPAIAAFAALGIAACGSSSSSKSTTSSSSASTPPATASTPAKKPHRRPAVPSRTYHVKMSGTAEVPKGAPKGSGGAVVALHGRTLQVCWRFAHLRGFTGPTFAHIHQGGRGTSGPIVVPLSTSLKFHNRGCVKASAAVIKAIEHNPHGYYVNIHSKKYPGGAVRAQL